MDNCANYPSLAGLGVFITGGATGIGAAMVEAFALQGARVAFVDLDSTSAEALCERIDARADFRPCYQAVDVTDVSALQESIQRAAVDLGSLRILINNAANDHRHDPSEVTAQDWRDCMAVNLDAAFFACQAAAAIMMHDGGGSIVNFSSINALLGPANMPGYVAAKAGIIGLTKALAADYGGSGIRVNAVLPGWVATERQLHTWLTPEAEADWMRHVALKQRLLPADVANLSLFLAADDSRMITGQDFVIDAGRT